MAGDLFVGVYAGGVQTDRTMYVPVRSRAGAAPAATWLRRVDAGPSRR
jgi:hypothetical protein